MIDEAPKARILQSQNAGRVLRTHLCNAALVIAHAHVAVAGGLPFFVVIVVVVVRRPRVLLRRCIPLLLVLTVAVFDLVVIIVLSSEIDMLEATYKVAYGVMCTDANKPAHCPKTVGFPQINHSQ